MSLLESSLGYATTEELDGLSRTLEETVRQFYQREREALRQDAAMGRIGADGATTSADHQPRGPKTMRGFWESAEPERFGVWPVPTAIDSTTCGARRSGVEVYTRDLAGIHMQELSTKLRQAREVVGSIEARDLRRGFTLTLLLLVAIVWLDLAGAAALHRPPHQQADSPADGRTHRLRRRRLGSPRRIERGPMRSGAPWTRSTTWPSSCGAAASGSST